MAVKTITIDLDAYTLLSHHKKVGQSFSEVIKEHVAARPTVATFRSVLGTVRLEARTLDAMTAQVGPRRL